MTTREHYQATTRLLRIEALLSALDESMMLELWELYNEVPNRLTENNRIFVETTIMELTKKGINK